MVTGASSGFGLLTCVDMAKRGFRVFGTVRSEAKKEPLLQAAREAGVEVGIVLMDLSRAADRRAAVQAVLDQAGRIDVLVNNAGYGVAGFVEDVTIEELREQFETNFFGTADLTKLVLPRMRERRSGSIIAVTSMAGLVASPAVSSYTSSKFALEGYFECLNYEMAPFGVKVSLVEPGQFPTRAFTSVVLCERSQSPQSPYHLLGNWIKALIDKRVAGLRADPRAVSRLITRIALKKRPRCRYAIGVDARVARFLQRVLPEFLFRGPLRVGLTWIYKRLESDKQLESA